MPESETPTPPLLHSFRRLVETFIGILEARLDLLSVEVKEEKARAMLMVGMAGAAMFAAGMMMIMVTALVVYLCRAHLEWIIGGFIVFYGCLAVAAWKALKRNLEKPFLPETINQLQKDREWLIPRQ